MSLQRRSRPCAVEGCERAAESRGWCITHYGNWYRNGDPLATTRDPRYRFEQATAEGPVPEHRPDLGPCLIFTGSTNGGSGYGQFRYNGRNGYAHRYAWESTNGPIPVGLTIDHLCRVRTCVRLAHLELVTGQENTRRAAAARTHCPAGHPLTGSNLTGKGVKRCLRCEMAQRKRGAARRTNAARGLSDTRVRYDQAVVREQIVLVRAAQTSIAAAARVIGCNPNYLGRRVWNETKADVRRRDPRCVRCGVEGDNLDVQHRKARGSGGTANPATSFGMQNLIALCRPCHDHVETHRTYGRTHGFAVPQWRDPAEVPVNHYLHGWAWITPSGYRPLTQGELWLLAGQWLADEMTSRGLTRDDETEVVRLSSAAMDLFGVLAEEGGRRGEVA